MDDNKLSFADWSDIAVGAFAVAALLFGAGWWSHDYYTEHFTDPKVITIVKQPRIEANEARVLLIGCTKQDFEEHIRTCRARARMETIK